MYQKGDTKKIPHLGANNMSATIQNLVASAAWHLWYVHPWSILYYKCVQKYFNNCHRMFGTVIWVHLNQMEEA